MRLLGRIVGSIGHGIKKIGQYATPVAKFIGKYHQPLSQVAHGIAMASNNQTAQKVTGGLLALSNAVSVRQKLNESNAKIAEATRANGGVGGVYNHATGKFNGT